VPAPRPEDDEVTAWTALLDHYAARGEALVTVAAGNSGELDHASGNARVQPPADGVNVLSVGAADRTGPGWARAPYSSVGPGRSPGLVKPDGVAFGGSEQEPFHVLAPPPGSRAVGTTGTSFAAPAAQRLLVGVRTHLGPVVQPLALHALAVHRADRLDEPVRAEVGWGRFPAEVEAIVTCEDDEALILFQGELEPGKYIRAPIPVPEAPLRGRVTIAATFRYGAQIDPAHPAAYTRDGLEVAFRPHSQKRKDPDSRHADSKPFFGSAKSFATEQDLRGDAMKWETCMHASHRFNATSLQEPVFDVHYMTREGGHASPGGKAMPYALVISVRAPEVTDLYNQIVRRYRARLEPLRPTLRLPVRR
jgi:hypothetical protein